MLPIPYEKPKTIVRKDSSVVISWENVFPDADIVPTPVFLLEILNNLLEWNQVYQGRKRIYSVYGLPPSTAFDFRLKAKCTNKESDWIGFKSATDTEQFYVRHLTRALQLNKIPLIRKIIGCRPSLLEIENHENKTPLIQAVEYGELALVNFLVILGAKVNRETLITRKTPLLIAFSKGHLDILEFLLRKKADIKLKDTNGLSGLHYAVDSNNLQTVEFALKVGFNVNEKDSQGWTPLLRSIIMEASDDIVILLLKNGADVNLKDNRGYNFLKHCELVRRKYLHKYQNKKEISND